MHSLGEGGLASGLARMAAGNEIGFKADEQTIPGLFRERYVSFLVESPAPLQLEGAVSIGKTYSVPNIEIGSNSLLLKDLLEKWQSPLEEIYRSKADSPHPAMETVPLPRPLLLCRYSRSLCYPPLPAGRPGRGPQDHGHS